jgi:hypothetical protein
MSNEPETFASLVFIVDGKTVDANGQEVKAEKPAETEKPKPAPKAKD